jgi:gamma-glutamyl:cysteine ligase YbdK (ATP-grasp superfamily)
VNGEDRGSRLPSGHGPAEAAWPEEPLALWEGIGVEIELMIVAADTLDVRPVADRLIETVTGMPGASDVHRGPIAWSNELALHVLELKTDGPAPRLEGLSATFGEAVHEASAALRALDCRLMPGGMHPWMDPDTELRLWPHEYTDVYRAFDRIFSCRGHGWANLQSTHVNLPFRGDEEFRRLHDAVRFVIPLIPAIAASSPFLDGSAGPALDNRLLAYRDNARRVPSLTGRVVPEPVRSRAEYRARVLEPMWRDLEPLDPEGILRDEWVNARGAIARFGRGAIEIRVIDQQESPAADLAVVAAIAAAVRRLADGPLADGEGDAVEQDDLVDLLDRTIHQGGNAVVRNGRYLDLLGIVPRGEVFVREVWWHLVEEAGLHRDPEWALPLRTLLTEGTLAERVRVAVGLDALPDGHDRPVSRERLRAVYRELCDGLEGNGIFRGAA